MRILEIIWPEDRVEHVSHHRVLPFEVEEVCFGKPLVFKAKKQGPNPVYYVLGQTNQGRYLLCIIIQFPDGKGFPVTARDMTDRERSRFIKWREK